MQIYLFKYYYKRISLASVDKVTRPTLCVCQIPDMSEIYLFKYYYKRHSRNVVVKVAQSTSPVCLSSETRTILRLLDRRNFCVNMMALYKCALYLLLLQIYIFKYYYKHSPHALVDIVTSLTLFVCLKPKIRMILSVLDHHNLNIYKTIQNNHDLFLSSLQPCIFHERNSHVRVAKSHVRPYHSVCSKIRVRL